jgi:predicted nuclease with TOPRIM domain
MTNTDGTGREPFRRIQEVSDVRNDVRQMQENLRELQAELRQLEWGLLGGRSMYDPAKAHKLCIVTSENMEYLAEEIDGLPRTVDEVDSDN